MLATATARALIPAAAGDEAQRTEQSRKLLKKALVALDKAEEVRPAGVAVPLDSTRAYYLLSQLQSVVSPVQARKSICHMAWVSEAEFGFQASSCPVRSIRLLKATWYVVHNQNVLGLSQLPCAFLGFTQNLECPAELSWTLMEERRQLWALLQVTDALKGSIRHYRISERHQCPMEPRQDMQNSGYTAEDVMDGFDNRARLHVQLALAPIARFITDHLYSARDVPTLMDVDVAHHKLAEIEEVIMVSLPFEAYPAVDAISDLLDAEQTQL